MPGCWIYWRRKFFPHAMWSTHPRHFAWVPGPSNFVGVMADTLAAGYNLCPTSWLEGAGPSQIELVALDWLRGWCALPETAGGVFVSGGSMANLTAIATARRVKLNNQATNAVVYCSEQVHSSVVRNLRVLGFMTDQIRKVAVSDDLRLSISALGASHRNRYRQLTATVLRNRHRRYHEHRNRGSIERIGRPLSTAQPVVSY